MSAIAEALTRLKGYSFYNYTGFDAIEAYVLLNDAAAFNVIPKAKQADYWVNQLAGELGPIQGWQDQERRLVRVIVHLGSEESLWERLGQSLGAEKEGQDVCAMLAEVIGKTKDDHILEMILRHVTLFQNDGRALSSGRRVLGGDDTLLAKLAQASQLACSGQPVAEFLAGAGVTRALSIAPDLLRHCTDAVPQIAASLLSGGGEKAEAIVQQAIDGYKFAYHKLSVMQALYDWAPDRYRDRMMALAREATKEDTRDNQQQAGAEALIKLCGAAAVPDVAEYMKRVESSWVAAAVAGRLVEAAGAAAALPLYAAMAENKDTGVRLAGLAKLVEAGDASYDALLEGKLLAGLSSGEGKEVLEIMTLTGKWKPERLQEKLWTLIEHKSKQVRDTAARALAKSGPAATARAIELLGHKTAGIRQAVASMLAMIGTAEALAALEGRVDEESNDDVRDQMLLGLEAGWAKQGRKPSRQDVRRRMERAVDKLKEPVAPWCKEEKLPALHWQDGKALTATEVRYMLYRQSRGKEMRPEIEAETVYRLIDRKSSGDFAAALLRGFMASKQDAGGRWALTVAGRLGDNQLVPVLTGQIRTWVDGNRGKLAEYAVQALALLGTDAALLAVDAMAIRYRNKMKNVGKAAAEAFSDAAEAQGITPEELGDRVVPWLCFKPGEPCIVGEAKAKFQVRIGPDFKLAFIDLAKNKPVKALPKSVPTEVAAEIKETAATLKEIVKAQTLRLENLLVRQRRWPVARWRELFLKHPVLFPFAHKLVWGCYDGAGKLQATFRPLEDGSLTTHADEAFMLPAEAQIGMVHPLELAPAARAAWKTHLADYEIEPPFPQIDREVVLIKPEQAKMKTYAALEDKAINAMTFKGRAEKLGWYRGSVCDGGGIGNYYKSFPTAGVEAILDLDGMFIGASMYDEIKLGVVRFVKANTVQRGSYVYDDPTDESDARVLAFEQVPPIVFSEAMGDLRRISGGQTTGEEEETTG